MRALTALTLLVASSAFAEGTEVYGYVDSRSQGTHARLNGIVSPRDVPQLSESVEVNGQVKHRYSEKGFLYGDLSLFFQFAGNYRDVDADGNTVVVPDHHVVTNDPIISLSELYLSHDFSDELNVLAGKKRIVWGPGFSVNPTDLINPPKDPTDPTFQRAGAYMGRVELTMPKYTLTFLAAPSVTESANGLPYRFLTYPKWDRRDSEEHYQLAARVYALVQDSDVNLMLFYGNRYSELEPLEDSLRGGVSFSRYFFTDYEFHLESLLQLGTARAFANSACVTDQAALLRCFAKKTPLLERTEVDNGQFLPRVLLGLRRQFDDESMISLEYLYQADGFTKDEFSDYARVLAIASRIPGAAAGNVSSATLANAVPQKFNFVPLVKHYGFFTYQKPRIADDWTFMSTLILNLQDLSGMFSPSLAWQPEEWLQLTLSAFVPFPGPEELSVKTPAVNLPQFGLSAGEQTVTEYGVVPFDFRALLSVRVFY